MQAHSLRIRTGNFLRPCRECKSAMREISALIREFAIVRHFGVSAPPANPIVLRDPGGSQRRQRGLLSSIYRRARGNHAASVKAWGDRRPVAARRAINRQPGNRGFGSWSSFVGRWPSGSATVSLHRGGRRCLIGALSNLRCRHAALWSGSLALAHDRSCEAEFAGTIGAELDARGPPDLETLGRCFAPHSTAIPDIQRRGGATATL